MFAHCNIFLSVVFLNSTFKKECPVKFTVAARKDGLSQCLTISKHEGQHNHDVSTETYRLYPSVRRLTPAERKQQEQLVSIVLFHLNLAQAVNVQLLMRFNTVAKVNRHFWTNSSPRIATAVDYMDAWNAFLMNFVNEYAQWPPCLHVDNSNLMKFCEEIWRGLETR